MQPNQPYNVLIAEDDDDHFFLTEKILKTMPGTTTLRRVLDGEELMEFLSKEEFRPSIIILDINMPKKDGWEALKEIKSHPRYRQIPVIVLSTSDVDEDKSRGYDLGANSYIRKPIDYKSWVDTIHAINNYWFNTVELPHGGEDHA